MKLFIELSLTDFFMSLSNDKGMVNFVHEVGLKEKSDYLPIAFENILKKSNISAKDINEFYVTKGPGSFMGIRAGLMFIKTLAQVLNKPLYTADTFTFMSRGIHGTYYLDAKTNESFRGIVGDDTKLDLVEFHESSTMNYEDLIQNINDYLKLFKKESLNDAQPLYLKEPKIG